MNTRKQSHTPRVLHVTSALDPGGIETWLSRLIEAPGGRPLVDGVLVLSTEEGLLAPRFHARGIPIFRLPVRSAPLGFAIAVAKLLRKTGPWDVVHSHVHRRSALIHLGALLAGVPVRVSHSHNTRGQETVSTLPLKGLVQSLATAWINWVSHARIACSREAAAALFGPGGVCGKRLGTHGVAEKRNAPVVWLPYGMDTDAFLRNASARVSRESLGIPAGSWVVGHVGRFMGQKNHRFLLQVAAEAARANPRVHFLLVGDGPLRTEMVALAAELGIASRVTFTGNRLDVPALMVRCMDCFFFPSLWEGLGIVMLEAQVAGLPCVYSDAVPSEADLRPGTNRIFSLKGSAEDVAGLLLEVQGGTSRVSRAADDAARVAYSLAGNVRTLESLYRDSVMPPR